MDYLSIAEGRAASGLRLILSAGVPGPWGESAKAVLNARGVPFPPVAQVPMAENAEIWAWTGLRNAPIAMLDDAPPAHGWRDILMLAERLGHGPSLLPVDPAGRDACLALCHDICGADGFGWNRRLSIMVMAFGVRSVAEAPPELIDRATEYGLNPAAVDRAPRRVAEIMLAISGRLHRRDYLFGDRLSAADLYWACFSAMVAPLPQDVNPMPAYLRPLYETIEQEVAAALDPALLAHRDRIFERHIGLPLDY